MRPALAAKAKLRWDRREKVHFLLYPERGLRLNETAADVLKLCDGTRTVDEIVAALGVRYTGRSPGEVRRDVEALLADLAARGLVVEG